MQSFIDIVLALALLFGLMTVLELLARKQLYSLAVARKVTHASVAILIAGVSITFLDYKWFVMLGLVMAVVLYFARLLPLKTMSDRSNQSYGEVFFAFGVAGAALICADTSQFVMVMALLGIADTMAYVVGNSVPSAKMIYGRTRAGSIAFTATALIICLTAFTPIQALLIAMSLSLCELFSPRGSDNLTVPILAAGLIVYLV